MENSKLIKLLKTFATNELREFKDYVASPFFNKNEELMLFFEYLKKIAPSFSPKKTNRAYAYKTIFPNRKYDEKHLNYLMSFLLKLAEDYIGYRKYQQQSILPEYHLLSSCIDRQLPKHYQNILRKSEAKLEQNPLRNTDYFYQKFLVADIADKYFQQQKIRKFDPNLQIASDNFDIYYLSNKLQYCIEMLDRQKFLSADYDLRLVKEIKLYLADNKFDHIPPIAIYYRILLTLLNEDADKNFQELSVLVDQHFEQFTQYEMKHIYTAMVNYCMRQIRDIKKNYNKELLVLYLKGIKTKVLLENGFLSPYTFKNIVKLGLIMKRFDWTKSFIFEYADLLPEEYQESVRHYSIADLNYSLREFDTAMEHLTKVEFSDIYYTLDAKAMLLKIYYELDEEDALLSLIASFKIFLKRNKLISNDVRKTYQNFISLTGLLIKKDSKQLAEIKTKIIQTKLLNHRNWLLQAHEKLVAVI